jgi:hypothetical protein
VSECKLHKQTAWSSCAIYLKLILHNAEFPPLHNKARLGAHSLAYRLASARHAWQLRVHCTPLVIRVWQLFELLITFMHRIADIIYVPFAWRNCQLDASNGNQFLLVRLTGFVFYVSNSMSFFAL